MGACGPRHRGVRHYFQKLKSTPLYSVSDCRLWRQTLAWWITKIVTALSHFGHFHRGAVCRLHVVVFSYIVLSHFEAQFIKKKSFFVHLDETLVMNLNWFPRWCSSNCNSSVQHHDLTCLNTGGSSVTSHTFKTWTSTFFFTAKSRAVKVKPAQNQTIQSQFSCIFSGFGESFISFCSASPWSAKAFVWVTPWSLLTYDFFSRSQKTDLSDNNDYFHWQTSVTSATQRAFHWRSANK